jgi:hypothetical protein
LPVPAAYLWQKENMSRRTKQGMYPLVEAWQSSSQSKVSFCQAHQINIHTFTYWLQKYLSDHSQTSEVSVGEKFVALEVEGKPSEGPSQCLELIYPNGVRLSFKDLVSPQYLESLIQLSI